MEKKIFPHLPLLNNDDDQIKCGNWKNFVIFQYFFLYPLCGRCRRRFLLHTSNIIIKYILPFLFSFFSVSLCLVFFIFLKSISLWRFHVYNIMLTNNTFIFSFSFSLCIPDLFSFFLSFLCVQGYFLEMMCVCVCACMFLLKTWSKPFFFGYQNIIIIIIRLLL